MVHASSRASSRAFGLSLVVASLATVGVARGQSGPVLEPLPREPPPSASVAGPSSAPRSPPPRPHPAGAYDIDDSASVRLLATGAAIVPGVVLHGSGHFVRGQRKTAMSLFVMELTGVGLVGVGLGGLAATGASRRVVTPLAMTTMVGGSLFLLSFVADVYGSARGDDPLGSPGFVPLVETSLGVRAIYDPIFPHRYLVTESIDARIGSWRISPSVWFAPDRPNTRARVELGYRFLGPRPEEVRAAPSRGSYLEGYGGVTHHAYTSDRFRLTTFEAMIRGRIDLRKLGRLLRGSFAELGIGTGVVRNHYDTLAISETTTLLLGTFAFGTYLGDGRGEAALVYDHRRDGLVGGARLPGIPAGFLGSGGVRAKYFFTEEVGVAGEMIFGGAYMGGLSLVVRQ